MAELRYGFEKRLEGRTFEQVVEQITGALKSEGFGFIPRPRHRTHALGGERKAHV
jgi:hypothetical protein